MKSLPCVIAAAWLLLASPAHAETPSHNAQPFGVWLNEFKQEARSKGIAQETLDEAFADTQPLDGVIELDRKQPESTQTFERYLSRAVSETRISEGRRLYAEHRELLEEIGGKYGVHPNFIVALWGIETNYGGYTGNFSTIDALATLAYDGRRSQFFRDELLKALTIVDNGHISSAEMIGSWAGAMGQCQFMPSSFLNFAVDYDKDGKQDIWSTPADIFASIANYLKSSGWEADEGWGREVSFKNKLSPADEGLDKTKTMREWKTYGVMTAQGTELPEASHQKASVILVGNDEEKKASYLVTNNYKVLLKWNRSRYFATAVSTLADYIEE